MAIINPHDKFVKDVISSTANAIDILNSGLTKEISEQINWSSITRESGSFISKELKEFQSDALFSMKTKKKSELNIYLLFEHKSYVEGNIYSQLGSYIWQIYRKQKQLTLIVPFVLYHGKKRWEVKASFKEEFNLDKDDLALFSQFIPDFSFSLMTI